MVKLSLLAPVVMLYHMVLLEVAQPAVKSAVPHWLDCAAVHPDIANALQATSCAGGAPHGSIFCSTHKMKSPCPASEVAIPS